MNQLPLANQSFLITRPKHQARALIERIEALGGDALLIPTVNIVNYLPVHTFSHHAGIEIAIFLSANAVRLAPIDYFKHLNQHTKIIAIGPGTAATLSEKGFLNHEIPKQYNSEGILLLLSSVPMLGKEIAIFCGKHPKSLLFRTLREQGAYVQEVICYERKCPTWSKKKCNMLAQRSIDMIITTSQISLKYLCQLLIHHIQWLQSLPILVISPEMSALAKKYQFGVIKQAQNATEDAIIHTLITSC